MHHGINGDINLIIIGVAVLIYLVVIEQVGIHLIQINMMDIHGDQLEM